MASTKETILITGASGFVGGNILKAVLDRGHKVVATGRSESTTKKIAEQFPEYKEQLTFAIVPDITKKEYYQDALNGITGVIHTASPFIMNPQDNEKDLLRPAIRGTLAILQAVKEWGSSVKRVVATSSHAANVDMSQGKRPGYVYNEKDWNPITYEEAAVEPDGAMAYCASKALAERAMWDFMEKEKPHFSLVTLTPPLVFGPYATELRSTKGVGTSIGMLVGLLGATEIYPFDFGGFVDVRDLAAAHAMAFDVTEAGGQRFWVGQKFQWQAAVDAAREAVPELREKLPLGQPGFIDDTYDVDGSKATRVLGLKYKSLGETMKDSFVQILHAQEVEAFA